MGRGHYVTMDSAYMGDLMAQIGREIWKCNLLVTCQSNRVGADIGPTKKAMKRGTYEAVQFQHKTKDLNAAVWSDNNIVSTCSNYHSPVFLDVGQGMRRRKKDKSGTRERHQSEVKCPEQNKDYSNTFGKIDSSNMKEQRYDLKFESKKHNWSPKLVFRIFGVNSQNAYMCVLPSTCWPVYAIACGAGAPQLYASLDPLFVAARRRCACAARRACFCEGGFDNGHWNGSGSSPAIRRPSRSRHCGVIGYHEY